MIRLCTTAATDTHAEVHWGRHCPAMKCLAASALRDLELPPPPRQPCRCSFIDFREALTIECRTALVEHCSFVAFDRWAGGRAGRADRSGGRGWGLKAAGRARG